MAAATRPKGGSQVAEPSTDVKPFRVRMVAVIVLAVIVAVVLPAIAALVQGVASDAAICEKIDSFHKPAQDACFQSFKTRTLCELERQALQDEIVKLWGSPTVIGVDLSPRPSISSANETAHRARLKETAEHLASVEKLCDKALSGPVAEGTRGFSSNRSTALYLIFYIFMGALILNVSQQAKVARSTGTQATVYLAALALFLGITTLCAWHYSQPTTSLLPYASAAGYAGVLLLATPVLLISLLRQRTANDQRRETKDACEGTSALRVIIAAGVYGLLTDGLTQWFSLTTIHGSATGVFNFLTATMPNAPVNLSWLLETSRGFCFSILVATVSVYLSSSTADYPPEEPETAPTAQLLSRMQAAASEFEQWQVNSVLLAGAFLPWTYYAWMCLASNSPDTRNDLAINLYQSIMDHLTWAAIWVLLSARVSQTFHAWRKTKQDFIAHTGDANDALRELITEGPISNLRLFIASIATATAFALPLLQLK